jgi:hypothetical protein
MNVAVETATTPGRANLRAYLAGTGATSALIAGAVVVFLAAAGFVAFNGMPFGGSGGAEGNVALEGQTASGASAAAAAALANAPGAVAKAPFAGAARGAGGKSASGRATNHDGSSPGGNFGSTPPPTGGDPPTCTTGCVPPPTGSGSGPITSLVNGVDQTGQSLGVDPGLGSTTSGTTQQLDDTVNNTLNHVQPGLGDQVDDTVNDATHGLLGP